MILFKHLQAADMTRKCSVIGCRTGYATTKQEKEDGKGNHVKGSVFGFPKDPSLCKLWEKFLCRKDFFVVSNTSGICFEHFESRFIKKNEGSTRVDLDYSLFPIPSIHTTPEILLNPSLKPLMVLTYVQSFRTIIPLTFWRSSC